MTPPIKFLFVVYLIAWTTIVAWASYRLMFWIICTMDATGRSEIADTAAVIISVAATIAANRGYRLVQDRKPVRRVALKSYFLTTPLVIYVVGLLVVFAMLFIPAVSKSATPEYGVALFSPILLELLFWGCRRSPSERPSTPWAYFRCGCSD